MQEKKESTLSIYEHKKYNTIIFLISIPLTTRDVNRFGFEILKKHGFYVKIYDFSDLINRKVLFKNSVVSEATNYHIFKIFDVEDTSPLFFESIRVFARF